MNQGRVWCVVHPTVGLPLLLGSVAATSLIVHACVMTHTTWIDSYWAGSWRNKSPETTPPPRVGETTPPNAPAFAVTITPVPGEPGKTDTSFVVSVTPNPGAQRSQSAEIAPLSTPGPLALAAHPAE